MRIVGAVVECGLKALGVASAPCRSRDRILSATVLHMGRSTVHPIP